MPLYTSPATKATEYGSVATYMWSIFRLSAPRIRRCWWRGVKKGKMPHPANTAWGGQGKGARIRTPLPSPHREKAPAPAPQPRRRARGAQSRGGGCGAATFAGWGGGNGPSYLFSVSVLPEGKSPAAPASLGCRPARGMPPPPRGSAAAAAAHGRPAAPRLPAPASHGSLPSSSSQRRKG